MEFMLERDRNKARRGLKGMEITMRSVSHRDGRQGIRELGYDRFGLRMDYWEVGVWGWKRARWS